MNFIEGMKVIFLDIDGALNSEEFWEKEAQHIRKKKAIAEGRSHDEASALANMDPNAVERIMRIVKETGAEIVVSSTWRFDDSICYKLRFMGIPQIYGITPGTVKRYRGEEIKLWLDEHPEVTNYVIIDDDSDMLDEQYPHLVQTSWLTGITDCDVEKAINILNN